jgi:hypothetical protein
MRIKRGTIPADREGRRLYVLLTPDPAPDPTETRTDELIAELRDRVRSLDDQLAQERQAHAEARRIIAGLVERMPPQLEAPQTASEAPDRAEEGPRSDPEGPQTGTERRWWQFWR